MRVFYVLFLRYLGEKVIRYIYGLKHERSFMQMEVLQIRLSYV